MSTKFQKNHTPWNKGKKGIHLSKKSEFKKGVHIGDKHPSWKGGIQFRGEDCIHIYNGVGKVLRCPRVVYEKHYGPIPKGFVIVHKDGDKHNDSPENLIAMSRKDHLKRNSGG
jgi:hypothetical protein